MVIWNGTFPFFQSPMDDDTIQLCGHIMGLIEFFSKISKSSPRLIRRKQSKFAIKVLGPYIMVSVSPVHMMPWEHMIVMMKVRLQATYMTSFYLWLSNL